MHVPKIVEAVYVQSLGVAAITPRVAGKMLWKLTPGMRVTDPFNAVVRTRALEAYERITLGRFWISIVPA